MKDWALGLSCLCKSGDMTEMTKVAVVTGANKGIGFGIVRKLCKEFKGDVILTARDEQRGKEACDKLVSEGLNPSFHQLDITSVSSIEKLQQYLLDKYQGLDVLVNNAGIAYKVASTAPFSEQAEVTCRTNFTGTLHVCQALFPILRPHARVVNISSFVAKLSQVSPELQETFLSPNLTEEKLVGLIDHFVKDVKDGVHQQRGWSDAAYGTSKLAVTALTRVQARQMEKDSREDILVNCCCPGWVRTDMAGPRAKLSIDEGAVVPVYLALLPEGAEQPQGAFYKNMKPIDWVTLQPLE